MAAVVGIVIMRGGFVGLDTVVHGALLGCTFIAECIAQLYNEYAFFLNDDVIFLIGVDDLGSIFPQYFEVNSQEVKGEQLELLNGGEGLVDGTDLFPEYFRYELLECPVQVEEMGYGLGVLEVTQILDQLLLLRQG